MNKIKEVFQDLFQQMKMLKDSQFFMTSDNQILSYRVEKNISTFSYLYVFIFVVIQIIKCIIFPKLILPLFVMFIPIVVFIVMSKNKILPEKYSKMEFGGMICGVGVLVSNIMCFMISFKMLLVNIFSWFLSSMVIIIHAFFVMCVDEKEFYEQLKNGHNQCHCCNCHDHEHDHEHNGHCECHHDHSENKEQNETTETSEQVEQNEDVENDKVKSD